MNKYIKIVACACMLMISNACDESFLDEDVLDKYVPVSLTDKLGFDAAVVGIHQHFGTLIKTTSDQTLIGMWHVGTDVAWAPAGRSNGDARPYFDYTQLNASDAASLKVWRYLYKLISNANILIAGAENSSITVVTQADKDVYNAEARFFRAYAYEMLVTLYGDVPLITVPLSAPKTDFVRATVAEVNEQIEEDLLFAGDHLPKIGEAAKGGRANKAMARQLLAQSYLRRNEGALAEAQCDEIINGNCGVLNLMTTRFGVNATKPGDPFSDLFITGNQRRSQGNNEVIWVFENENPTDKPYSTDSPQQRRVWGGGYYDIGGMLPADSLGGRGIGRVRLNNWVLYSLYEDNDMRNSKHNIRRNWYFNNTAAKYDNIRGQEVPYGVDTQYTLSDGTTLKVLAADTVWRLAPYTTKWAQFDSRDSFGYGMWKDFILMRLAETYLLRAEARLQQGDAGGAASDLNVIRSRSNVGDVSAADVDLNFILDERARELLAEENRRVTLVRTGTLIERATTLSGETKLGDIETTNGLKTGGVPNTKYLLMPIPQLEIDLNVGAELRQNDGY